MFGTLVWYNGYPLTFEGEWFILVKYFKLIKHLKVPKVNTQKTTYCFVVKGKLSSKEKANHNFTGQYRSMYTYMFVYNADDALVLKFQDTIQLLWIKK